MTRNLGAHPTWLSKPSKFCYFSYMVITPNHFKILLSLLWISLSTISKFYQPYTWNSFGLVISLNCYYCFSLEIGGKYVSNILLLLVMLLCWCHTMLFSLNILCQSIRKILQVHSPTSLPLTDFP